MDKYVVRMTVGTQPGNNNLNIVESSEKRARIDTTSDDIVSDPARRKSINEYDPRIRDDVRRKYVQIGPCQPLSHNFRPSPFGDSNRSFQAHWFTKWEWLEYSVCENAAFCFWCYLFGDKRVKDQAFTKKGFRNWKKATEKFKDHIGNEGSIHNNARMLYIGFKDQRQSVTRNFLSGNEITGAAYRMRLTASVDIARLFLGLGLAFRGNDESLISMRRGNFLEILAWYSLRNIDVGKVVKENAPVNHQLTSPYIQKQIVSACASETTKAIICKRRDELRQKQHDNMVQQLENSHITTGRGLNQVFVFIAHLMKLVLGITNSLSQFLQQKDQNIIEAMHLVSNVEKQLRNMRENGWDELLEDETWGITGVFLWCIF